jgi:outer membrane protein OmpA-like peptidoglycan-associated protein
MRSGTVAQVCVVLVLSAAGAAQAGAPDVASIQPVKGLLITSTIANGSAESVGSGGVNVYRGLDEEVWDALDSTDQEISHSLRFSVPANAKAEADLGKTMFHRRVRREDIAQSLRLSMGISTLDPEMFAGQTFLETSVKALGMLKTGADVPFVIGAIDDEDASGLGALTKAMSQMPPPGGGKPGSGSPASLMTVLQVQWQHTYYRGAFRRVEPSAVALPVLLNGARVNLPAIHAQGTFTSASHRSLQLQYWWLDSPTWPLALKLTTLLDQDGKGVATVQVTRIDLPPPAGGGSGGAGGGGGAAGAGTAAMADQLKKSCHLELTGIYFNTGSAFMLAESQPALKAIAQVVLQSKEAVLTVEGHTDNVGTAQFNQDLSEKRAAAVRQALVSQFGVPPTKLVAKGFGFSRPVESNDTIEGRAHNRRVELACARGQ